ncbi:MAG: polysaccharide deacetylase family protein [Candidatus Zixiibacteriota bacterium]|nr:MAG: polysaccharide deacetylase family protein [candidate division Zixibacteria bacterium]
MNAYRLILSVFLAMAIFPAAAIDAGEPDPRQNSARKIAISFDDLPTLSHDILTVNDQIAYFNRIMRTLEQHNVRAIGFLVGQRLRPENEHLVRSFIDAGHLVGNHTFNHWDLNKVSASDYIRDIEKCSNLISQLDMPCKYFRYPFLHRGDDVAKKDSVLSYLERNEFIIAPVSIDNDEAGFNLRFVKALQSDSSAAQTIGQEYVEHMIFKTEYYERLAVEVNGKAINHILLLHMNLINSYYLDTLLDWYEQNGWEFISIEEALSDPFYSKPDSYVGEQGLSYIERVTGKE